MRIHDESTGVTVELTYDADGFPLIDIDTGGGFHDENLRPTVHVILNGQTVHEMFDPGGHDLRWDEAS